VRIPSPPSTTSEYVGLALAGAVFLGSACGGNPAPPPSDPGARAVEGGLEIGPDKWGTFRSKRFALVLRLPGGSEWRVDDRSQPHLLATHAATGSRVRAERWNEPDIQTRATCEARARLRKLLPPPGAMVVEDAAGVRPNGDDVRIWVALEPGPTAETPIRGHAALVGAQMKKCWAVHYETQVPSAKQDADLSARLAVVREGVLERVTVEDARLIAPPRETRR
jgi:hypothetical protein